MAGEMWFSTSRFGAWIAAPQSPMKVTRNNEGLRTKLLNGQAYVSRMPGSYLTYAMTWKGNAAQLRTITDIFDGLYGPSPYYFLDPSAADNHLPKRWSAPGISGTENWPNLITGLIATVEASTFGAGLPAYMATYTFGTAVPVFDPATTQRAITPIPPGYTYALTAWGSVTGTSVIRVNRYARADGALSTVDLVPTTGGASITVDGNTYSHAEVWLTKTSTAVSTITLAGMVATVTTAGTPPSAWTSGQGASAVQLEGGVDLDVYTVYGDGYAQLTANLTEVI